MGGVYIQPLISQSLEKAQNRIDFTLSSLLTEFRKHIQYIYEYIHTHAHVCIYVHICIYVYMC